VFVQTGSQGTVVNKGRIMAAQVSLQAADGNVYVLAGSGTRVRATGTASRDGYVWLVADRGRVDQLGKIAASNAESSGGTVATQAAHLAFGKHAPVHADTLLQFATYGVLAGVNPSSGDAHSATRLKM
jgi:hypothetical protein